MQYKEKDYTDVMNQTQLITVKVPSQRADVLRCRVQSLHVKGD